MVHEFTIGVFAIITDESNSFLLCHRRDYDIWDLPGGGLEQGETLEQGLIREVKEETGLDVEAGKLIGVYSKPSKSDIVFLFKCNALGGKLTLNEEARDLQYFTFEDIPQNTSPKYLARIKDYLEDFNEVIIRDHSGLLSGRELLEELGI